MRFLHSFFSFFIFYLLLQLEHIDTRTRSFKHSFAYTYTPLLFFTHPLSFVITSMADIELSSLHFDSRSFISYPPSIVMKPSLPSSTIPIIPIPDLFAATSFDISHIRPCPEPYPPAARRPTYIIARRFRFGLPHPHIPCNSWHITTRPTPLLHSGMRVTIQEYGVVDIWELRRFSTSEWVVYQCTDWKTGRRLICVAIGRNWVERSTWDMVLAFFALLWRDFIQLWSGLVRRGRRTLTWG
jgi:hypothetical protein